ncbi:MAG: DNA cytosine methyltransferase [Pirellula sp.]
MRSIEFYAGIGGLSAACPWLDVVAAFDIDRDAQSVFQCNFTTPYHVRELESVPVEWIAELAAELWWLSPPCTPFTRRGHQRDIEDPRTRSFQRLMQLAAIVRPKTLVIENVVGFESSAMFAACVQLWEQHGYRVSSLALCPSQLGWPNTRPRIYTLATLDSQSLDAWVDSQTRVSNPNTWLHRTCPTLARCLQPEIQRDTHPWLWLDPVVAERYASALDVVDPEQPDAIAACFASSYGKAVVRSGSVIRCQGGLRRFAPREVANLLGFPESFTWPDHLSPRRLWHLLGNSLAIPAVAHCMQFSHR